MNYGYVYLSNLLSNVAQAASGGSSSCAINQGGSFFEFPKWYKYLQGQDDGNGGCSPALHGLSDIWLIVFAIIEILLRVAILLAIVYVLIGGVSFITSRGDGNSGKINKARNTIVDALVGLLIAIAASAAVSFIAGRFSE